MYKMIRHSQYDQIVMPVHFLYAIGHDPRSSFLTGAPGIMSKLKMSTGKPSVVQALGI